MTLLATLISGANGIIDIYSQATYGSIGNLISKDQCGAYRFAEVLAEPAALYTRATYERVVMKLTGGFAD